tara:strand:- start:133 stop:921 length:789 start_codon:yes stop_codon:yes gene_type:complete
MYIRPETGEPFYVGKGQRGRAWSYTGHSHNKWLMKKLDDIRSKYKSKEFVMIVEENLTEQEAYDMEAGLVNKYGKKFDGGILWNIADGGGGGCGPQKGYKQSEAARANSKASWTPERKAAMSEHSKGYNRTDEWCKNISDSKRKFSFNKEHFEQLVKDGYKLKEIQEEYDISKDIMRDRLQLTYGTSSFREVKSQLISTEEYRRLKVIKEFNVKHFEQLVKDNMTIDQISQEFNISRDQLKYRYSVIYNTLSFTEVKSLLLL